jgi:hypothetical protein
LQAGKLGESESPQGFYDGPFLFPSFGKEDSFPAHRVRCVRLVVATTNGP